MYIPLGGFFTHINRALSREDSFLPINNIDYAKLLQTLPYGGYSFLLLKDGNAVEFVKVTNSCGKLVLIRGVESTNRLYFRCGSIVKFAICSQGIMDFVCQTEKCTEVSGMYVSIAGFKSKLIDKLADIDTDLPIHDQHIAILKKRLGDTGYTYLRLYDGNNIEYVKIISVGGNISLERGLELTTPTTFPIGSCVTWEITPMAIRDIVCQMPCCPDEV